MAPQIRFVRGTRSRIACAVDGSGPPLILPAWWVSHVERDFADPAFSRFFTRLADHFTVVRYDRPGVGLSDRERASFTVEDEVATLQSVIDDLGVPRVSLLAVSCGTIRAALVALVRASWGIGAKALSDIFTPEATAEEARRFAVDQRHSATPEIAARLLQLTFEMEVKDLVERIRVPTLVLHRRQDGAVAFAHGRDVAARLPGARLLPLEGRSHLPWQGDPEPVLLAIGEFLGRASGAARSAVPPPGAGEFRRQGEVWAISFAGQTVHLKHARGLNDLALLLAHPGRPIHSAELMVGQADEPATRFGADATLDERARLSFRRRISELDEQLERAQAAARDARVAGLEDERAALLEELRAATGLGGRRRALGDSGERARKAVTARIRDCIARLHQVHPALASHLESSVSTGTYCVYASGAGTWST
jgi:pimeloyl-ACP methyl ester carboxylesterase